MNRAKYTEVYFKQNLIDLNFVKYINDDNNERKNLLILTNINYNHSNLAYYNITLIYQKF